MGRISFSNWDNVCICKEITLSFNDFSSNRLHTVQYLIPNYCIYYFSLFWTSRDKKSQNFTLNRVLNWLFFQVFAININIYCVFYLRFKVLLLPPILIPNSAFHFYIRTLSIKTILTLVKSICSKNTFQWILYFYILCFPFFWSLLKNFSGIKQ